MRLKTRKILALIVSWAGFSTLMGCCAYGTPYSNLKISGKVTDQNNNPVANVRLELKDLEDNLNYHVITSDLKGNLSYYHEIYGGPDYKEDHLKDGVNAVFYGKNNPGLADKYKDDSVRVKSVYKEGKGSWHTGDYKIDIQLKLRPKSADD